MRASKIYPDKLAFSLVELSIVLVILGLLVGGVLSGQALIRAAELRAVGTEHQRYITAVKSFRGKYFALPGDMTNATAFWGPLDLGNGIGSDCRGESSGLPTCNGDGDGAICRTATCSSGTFESFLFWKHLANAGLIEGTYSGSTASPTATTCISSTDQVFAGCNVPASKLSRGGWHIYSLGTLSAHPYLFDGQYGNGLQITGLPNDSGGLINGLIRPAELWAIDTKIDDGRPGTGFLVASRWNACSTGAANTAGFANAQYLLNPPAHAVGNRCTGVFRNQI
jgi:prepilin-type N-terminal cleavage/methylation domain-containing protein